ncbi:type IV toxin-antitoxin system AbiEi family antitoxin domain-containing protein [Iamia sp. SCSIO 61187]|uniref:endonuclease domain-containing protein n=1 Tax=Iamia sp. SCSIO 61187 TaxID=2722752 RepID=UPI001C633529|nr:endonuclease domain-containing protein [Iamia sp. SCSIO 61187]QYG94167.1 type IV toxin-antitoxin system AbiEi family antitoxin domain-containing protein [Iamia sp. SCSIO 61187]
MDPVLGRIIADLARRQHGIVSRRQLEVVGMSVRTVQRQAHDGLLLPAGARTYRLASAPVTGRSILMAATFDKGAAASHRAGLWLAGATEEPERLDVTVPKGRSMRRAAADDPRLEIHSTTSMPECDIVVIDRIRSMNLARSVLGAAALVPDEVSPAELVDVVASVIETGRASIAWLRWMLDERRCRGRDGVTALEEALDTREQVGPTDSWLERRTLELLDEAGLPRPVLQQRIPRTSGKPARVDFLFVRERVVLEVLGWAFHRTMEKQADDMLRAGELQMQGYTVLQLTALVLRTDPVGAIAHVRDALAAAPLSLRPTPF